MWRSAQRFTGAGLILLALAIVDPAAAQKSGGILRQ
jgi:hypothetical protein